MLDPSRVARPAVSVADDPAARTPRELEALRHRRTSRSGGPPRRWRRRGAALAAVAAAALGASASADAAPGQLDPAFGDGGVTIQNLKGTTEQHHAVALAPGGRIVAAGEALARPIVAAYLPDGRPDPAFGTDGIAAAKAAELGPALGVAVDGEGRIVTVGRARGVEDEAAGIARFTPAGEPDETFNRDGHVILDGRGDEVLHDVAVDPAGGIVAVGEREARNGDAQILLVRLTATGAPDPAFGERGQVVLEEEDAAAYAVSLLPDGRIQVAGRARQQAMLARVTADGRPDRAFAEDGIGSYPAAGNKRAASRFTGLVTTPDAAVVAVGWGDAPERGSQLSVLRVDAQGALDEGFGVNGFVLRDPTAAEDRGRDIALAPDGRIVVAGWHGGDDAAGATWLLRLTAAGRPDRTFGADSEFVEEIGPGAEIPSGLAVQPDGHAVFAGAVAGSNGDPRLLVGRVLGDLLTPDPPPVNEPAPDPQPVPLPDPVNEPTVPVPDAGPVPAPVPAPPAGAPTGGAATDRTAPVLRGLDLVGRARLAVRGRTPVRGRTRPQVRFTANEAGTVVVAVQRRTTRGRHVRVGAARRVAMRAGRHRVAMAPRTLRAGRYRVAVTAIDRAGNRAPARYVTFRVRAAR